MSNPTPTDHSSPLPLRPALRETDSDGPRSPKSGPAKVVSIASKEEEIPPVPLSEELPSPSSPTRPKVFTASTAGRRLTGRSVMSNSSSRASLRSQSSLDEFTLGDAAQVAQAQAQGGEKKAHHHHPAQHHTHRHDRFVAQVTEWLQAERARHVSRKAKRRAGKDAAPTSAPAETADGAKTKSRTSSLGSDEDGVDLEKLQQILESNMAAIGSEPLGESSAASTPRRPSHSRAGSTRRASLLKKLSAGHGGSSDTEHAENDVIVPSCDVVLDNSKTMSYTGGANESSDNIASQGSSKRADKEKKCWSNFKLEILKLAHTLKLKGWRSVPFERSDELDVERLSGALTNAVYVVSPPKNLPAPETNGHTKHRHPNKLLLRIYGPQVEHLIDRENELGILRRLARKKIGPRLLGTFENGRFEEFFNAQTLRPEDLRDPDTSKQIAKRMRELHDGVDLLEKERDDGPFVWMNWDKWVGQCEQVMTYLDKEIKDGNPGNGEGWRKRGLICGVEWPLFRATVEKYRKWLHERYEKNGGINKQLVFAHNDTQYGNILRLIPEKPKQGSSPSPLLLPQNTHRQLIVIDFEYASANTPGLEFANHFTEWCYNYHDEKKPWQCDINNYPTLAEQKRFIRSYVNHRPQFNPKASATPKMTAVDGGGKGSISDFLLDQRTPGGASNPALNEYAEDERRREADTEERVKVLLEETRWWRVANSAQWTAWGIVQAEIPELAEETGKQSSSEEKKEEGSKDQDREKVQVDDSNNTKAGEDSGKEEKKEQGEKEKEGGGEESKLTNQEKGGAAKEVNQTAGGGSEGDKQEEEDEEEEFDYLAYAQDRAMFFWGDVVALGLIGKEELPEKLRERIKILDL